MDTKLKLLGWHVCCTKSAQTLFLTYEVSHAKYSEVFLECSRRLLSVSRRSLEIPAQILKAGSHRADEDKLKKSGSHQSAHEN